MTKGLTTKALFEREDVKNKFKEMLGKRATSFITSVLQITTQNQLLSKADPVSIYQSAAVAATLDLPLNQNLGFAYIVPYNQSYKDEQGNWQKKQVAQFQMGYKGFIQLAQRSGQFKSIYAAPIYQGQIVSENPLEGYEFDFTKKSEIIVGYAAKFKLLNGYEATMYMTIEQLKKHGSKYSKTYTNDKGLWNTDFEAMASKTVLKLLLSKFAPLSVDMQRAVVVDQAVINDYETVDVTHIDNPPHEPTEEEIKLLDKINKSVKPKDLMELKTQIEQYPHLADPYETRFSDLLEKEEKKDNMKGNKYSKSMPALP